MHSRADEVTRSCIRSPESILIVSIVILCLQMEKSYPGILYSGFLVNMLIATTVRNFVIVYSTYACAILQRKYLAVI